MSHAPRSRRTRRLWSVSLTLAMVAAILPLGFSAQAVGNKALQFNGTSQYATVGNSTQLRLSQFTLETWFKWNGAGTIVSTGSGGITDILPLISKGRSDADDNNANNVNYILGIDQSSGVLVADFEEDDSGPGAIGLNHPISGTTAITTNVWHHAAATYDGTTWRLFLDGNVTGAPETESAPPANQANILTSIGSALNTGGVAVGAFGGTIDEVRIWNTARSQAQIQASMNTEQTTPTANLVGRWGLDEDTGSAIADASGSGFNGTTVANPSWVDGFNVAPPVGGANGLQFDGVNDYVTFGQSTSTLGATNLTLETWFRQTGPGATTGTGSGGVTAVPLLAKGRSENDTPANVNMNYFLGIDANGKLVVDFEDAATGLNHPFTSASTVTTNVWHHAAATYDGSVWRVYLDGALDGTSGPIGATPESNSIQHASLGSALNSTGVAAGFFAGQLDEARIWNVARSGAQIANAMSTEIAVPSAGLRARWGMNETSGASVPDTAGQNVTGTATGGPTWVPGAPFAGQGAAPAQPVLVAPADGASGQSVTPTLDVTVTDPDTDPMDVTFYGRPLSGATPPEFTIGMVPDTQWYSENAPDAGIPGGRFSQYTAQMQWLVDTRSSYNTQFVTHMGDIVQNVDSFQAEWIRADSAQDILDNNDVPNSVAPGNHDISSGGVANFYDQYFPPSRYENESWYGGYLGDPTDSIADPVNRLNKDNYQLFEVGSLKFLMISLEVGMPQYSVDWADDLIDAYPDRRVIISTHAFIDTNANRPSSAVHRPDGLSAQAVWTQLVSPNCNVDFVLNGHYHEEARRVDNNSCGEPVHQILADFQDRIHGGDGWLRMLTFQPTQNEVDVYTYSPTSNNATNDPDGDGFEEDSNSQFTLAYNMAGNPWVPIGTASNVASGAHATVQWNGLQTGTSYEWYAVANDGIFSTQGPTSTFSTGGTPNQPPVIDSVTINPTNPKTNDTLSATVTSHDPEGSTVSYTYQWLRNGSNISGATNATLNLSGAGNGNKGDQISLQVRGSDGSLQGAPLVSSSVTIGNSAPSATVSLNDTTPQDNEILTATATRADVDGDTVTLTYVWRVNGTTRKTTPASSLLTDTFDTSLANNGNPGDTITVTVTPNDGTENGSDAVGTAVIGSPNVAPVANGQDQITQRNTALALTLTGSDANSDPLTYTIVSQPAHGTLSGTGAARTYTPATGYAGTDLFTFRVNDGAFDSPVATVNLIVGKPVATQVTDAGFAKASISTAIGNRITWTNTGSNPHTVTDSTGLQSFDSGTINPGGTYAFTFYAAGNYAYTSTLNPGFSATVKVPVLVSQGSGDLSTVFQITWAGQAPPPGYVYDVQIKRNAAAWANWRPATTLTRANYTADAGTGTFKFRARLHRLSPDARSAWSGAKTITIVN